MKKRSSEVQIIGFLCEAEAGMAVKDLCRKHGFSEASYYLWRSTFGRMSMPEAKLLKELQSENSRLKKLSAESILEIEITREALRDKGNRTGATASGAADGGRGDERATGAGGGAHERQCAALPDKAPTAMANWASACWRWRSDTSVTAWG